MRDDANRGLAVAAWLGLVLAGCSLTFMGVATLAPRIAADSGLPPEAVGWYAGTVWSAGLVASFATAHLVARWGPWAVTRLCLLACAVGIAVMVSGNPWLFAVAAVLIGLGQGLEAPAASQLLAHHVVAARRPLYFSLKQMGVQVGAVVASLCMPLMALTFGWQVALGLVASVLLVTALLLSRPSKAFAMQDKTLGQAARSRAPGRSWLLVLRQHQDLRRLALAACTFGATQVCMNSFLVTWMMTQRDAGLTQAGLLAATAQGAGLIGRPLWGWVAGRHGGSIRVLRFLGLLMCLCAVGIGVWGSTMSPALLALTAALFGLSASGWNGVFLSEVATRSMGFDIAAGTAAAMVPLYGGLIAGPLLFAAVSHALDMSSGFVLLSVTAGCGTWMLTRLRA